MMEMFYFNFGFWFGFYISFPSRISPEIHLFLSNWTLCTHGKSVLVSIGDCGINHLIGHNFMMQMFSFNFGFWFGFYTSFPSRISPEIHLFLSNWTLCTHGKSVLVSIGDCGINHLIGHNFMMQMFSFIFGVWFGFYSSFPSRISPEIHLFLSNWTLCTHGKSVLVSIGDCGINHLIGHNFMMQMFSFIFGFWFGF